jgi:hypothetical protein
MRRLSLWAERKWEQYNFGPDYPIVMFWLITALFLLQYALVVQVIVDYYSLLLRRAVLVLSILILYPLTWSVYYRMHRRFKKLSEAGLPPNQRLMKELQALSISLVTGFSFSFGACLWILRGLLKEHLARP